MAYYTWKAPLRGQYKINVHVIHFARQYNGNSNGVGIIIRDHRGRLIKALTGSMRGISPLAVQLWVIHLGLNHARLSNYEIVLLETGNFNPFFEVTRQGGLSRSKNSWATTRSGKTSSNISQRHLIGLLTISLMSGLTIGRRCIMCTNPLVGYKKNWTSIWASGLLFPNYKHLLSH